MLHFFTENLSSIIIGLLILSALFFACRHIIREKKSGHGGCGGGCSGCAMRGQCQKQEK